MPVVSIKRDLLFKELGKVYGMITQKNYNKTWIYSDLPIFFYKEQSEFEDLCFDFGVELDDVVSILYTLFSSFINR